jgi:hypothetical protein
VRAEDIHLSYTNPLTSHARPWDWGARWSYSMAFLAAFLASFSAFSIRAWTGS